MRSERAGLAILLFAGAAHAGEGVGSSAFHFLSLGSSARIEALGGAGTSLASGADAMSWNPAHLAKAQNVELSASFFNWLDDVQSGYVGGVMPLGRGGLGAAARTLRIADFGNVPSGEKIGQSDFAGAIGIGYPLFEQLSGGLSLQAFRSSLAEEEATGWAIGGGLAYRYADGWDLGASVRNAGPRVGYVEGVEDRLPTEVSFGVGGTAKELRFGTEVSWENGPGWAGALGAEYWIGSRLALRAGSRLGVESTEAAEPWSVGVGVRARSDLEVEYAFRDGVLDPSHRVGIRWTPGRVDSPAVTDAASPREFFVDVLNDALDRGLADFPADLADTVTIRPKKPHDASDLIAEEIARRVGALGYTADIKPALPEITQPLDPEVAKQAAESLKKAGLSESSHPTLEFDIKRSDYVLLSRTRERLIGPQTIERRAAVELDFELRDAGGESPRWSSSCASEETGVAEAARVAPSAGYPKPEGTGAAFQSKRHPLVEPALVGGLVAGLAIIFFANRNVGE
jgi:hypothetical protein